MRILILFILAIGPVLSYSQECPMSTLIKSGFVVIKQSKFDTVLYVHKGGLMYPHQPCKIGYPLLFVPSDSVSAEHPISFWIEHDENLPSIYSLWDEQSLMMLIKKRCDTAFCSVRLVEDYILPKVGAKGVKVYDMTGGKYPNWYYRVHYLEGEWLFLNISEEDYRYFSFNPLTGRAVLKGKTPFFALEKVLEYRADASFEDKRLVEYKVKTKNLKD